MDAATVRIPPESSGILDLLTPFEARIAQDAPLARAALYAAAGSTIAVLFSIAASQILLGLAILLLLVSKARWRVPPIWIPLAVFMGLTVLSLVLSQNPAAGLPQTRKFYVYTTLAVVFTAVRSVRQSRMIVLAWGAAGAFGAVLGIMQFIRKAHEAHLAGRPFYEHYVSERIRGFMGNWQTFGGEQMIVLLMLLALLAFSPRLRGWMLWAGWAAVALLAAALLLGYTRGIWLASACGALYLAWHWRRALVLLLPVAVALLLWLNPGGVRERFQSAFAPKKNTDSNQHRVVCWRTGWEMIKAHPWIGLGPEMVRLKFMDYVPRDIPRPLPEGWYGHLHNVYLHYAAERGVAAALAIIAILLMACRDFTRALRRLVPGRSDARFLLHGAFAVVLAIMVGAVFEHNLGDSEVLAMFLATVALGYVAREEAANA